MGSALQSHIKLIVLDLDDSDEPQAIFETLNAHGTPLLPSDLVKNWLLWEASRQKLGHVEKMYQTWWRGFDADSIYWRAKIGTGHAARPRIDTFLQNCTAFRTAWESRAFYGNLRRVRVLMILQAIEEFYQREGDKGEPIVTFDFSSLEIEHILPQEWEANWPLPETEGAKLERERRLHGIGNLTLVSGKLNPSLSNAAWLDGPNGTKGKRDLFGHSKLQMNARLAKHWGEAWNHAAIDSRASVLFEAARKIWPPPPAQGVLS